MEPLRTFDDIEVKLVGAIAQPYEVSVASARTCYSGKGVIYPEEVSKDEKAIQLRDRIAASTREAGHLTTRQHAHFVFALSGVSRHFVWNFLHSHPYYNSEQVSQRYVKVKPGNFLLPSLPTEQAKEIFLETVKEQTEAYERLISLLKQPIAQDFFDRFKARAKQPDKWMGAVDKRAFEVARYVLGVGTTCYLYHTVSSLTLLRYRKMGKLFDTPHEQKIVIEKMIEAVLKFDPLFEKELEDPIPLEKTLEYSFARESRLVESSEDFIKEFDESLEGRISKLESFTSNAEDCLSHALRVSLGKTKTQLPTSEALAFLLDPKTNPLLADTLNPVTLDRLTQSLHHVHFTFRKKLSHTADSQDQRHRTILSNRPLLYFHYSGKPDYVTPFGVTQSPAAHELYTRSMEKSFGNINKLLEMGVSKEWAFYLLPNAVSVRMVSSGDLLSYQHKWKLRSCYNAQEEIFRATLDEISQVRSLFPQLAEHLRAPCYLRLRAGVKPFCPEGDRFCGLPVWKYDLSDYRRKSL